MKLREIINLNPLPFNWLTDSTCIFEFNTVKYGILLESSKINVGSRVLRVGNIVFGRLKDENTPPSENNLDCSLTNAGNPRTILATVSDACVNNDFLKTHDIITLGAVGFESSKRVKVYSMILPDLTSHLTNFQHVYTANTQNMGKLIALSKSPLSEEEIDYISDTVLDK